MSGSMVPEGNAQHALQAHFSWDSHVIASTHTLLSFYYSLIVGHIMNRKTKSETGKKNKKSLAWKQSSLTVGHFSYSHSTSLLPGLCHVNQSKYSIRLY